jgi:hypothetical protein
MSDKLQFVVGCGHRLFPPALDKLKFVGHFPPDSRNCKPLYLTVRQHRLGWAKNRTHRYSSATVEALHLNHPELVNLCRALHAIGEHPPDME